MKHSRPSNAFLTACVLAVLAACPYATWAQVPTISSPDGEFVAAQLDVPSADRPSADVLWDQPLSGSNTNAYVTQIFPDYPGSSSFLADDFTNTQNWIITSIFVPGDGFNGFSTMYNANSLNWYIYADDNGTPAGEPLGGGSAPFWSLSLTLDNPQIIVTPGTNGYPSNTLLELATPINLPPGTWWLIFYPELWFAGGGQYGRQLTDTIYRDGAMFINPGGAFGVGTAWQSISAIANAPYDLAFRLEGAAGCETDNECDDGLYCTGVETCDNGTCVATGDPCGEGSPVCDEDNGTCVECLTDDNCSAGQFCDEGICRFPCELFIKYKEIRAEKLTKDRKWVFFITGGEDFDLFGQIDLGPITWDKVKFSKKKNMLQIKATVPAGLEPGAYPVSVGECSGEIIVTGNDI